MSVVINTNAAATMAANNLAGSNALLQRSLNRLSSGSRIVSPADDAGGLAVSMKLGATVRRQAAVANNIGNATSFLQTQDGVLSTLGRVLTRITELKTLSLDPTKNSTDIGNYNAEFAQLQTQIGSLAAEKFNGVALFGSSGLDLGVTADSAAGSTVNVGAAQLLGTAMSVGMDASDWTASDVQIDTNYSHDISGAYINAGESTVAFHGTGAGSYTMVGTVGSAGFSATFDVSTNGASAYAPMNITAGGNTVNLTGLLTGTADHRITITDNGSTASISVDGGAATNVASLGTGSFAFQTTGRGIGQDFHLAHFSLSGLAGSAVNEVKTATNLESMSHTSVASAIQEVATLRATNGAGQSRLGFAAEVLTTNKANIEAANSRIVDIDVAAESTQLARYNILAQAGSAMLSQANQSTQLALKLLG